jgi:hypothetical protein
VLFFWKVPLLFDLTSYIVLVCVCVCTNHITGTAYNTTQLPSSVCNYDPKLSTHEVGHELGYRKIENPGKVV